MAADIEIRKAYLWLFIEHIEADDDEVPMFGSKDTLERTLGGEKPAVPGFIQKCVPGLPVWVLSITSPSMKVSDKNVRIKLNGSSNGHPTK